VKSKSERRPPIKIKVQLKLWVHSGGRCAFSGCNKYLLRDSLTLTETNYADIAHIVAYKPGGARGDDPMPMAKRNEIGNLMLACKKHHSMIDKKELERKYPKEKLIAYKREHEARIFRLTAIKPANKTSVITFKCKIGADIASVELEDIFPAIVPRYPVDEKGTEVNLTAIPGIDEKNYWEIGRRVIEDRINELFRTGVNGESVKHLSVFPFGPIPFLIFLGSCIGSKVPADVYQKHRDTGNWTWKKSGKPARYKILPHSTGKNNEKVILILSLSGQIPSADLPQDALRKFPVYEITLAGQRPHPMFLKTKRDLENFRHTYLSALRMIKQKNNPKEILLFPAVPISAAVICGMERIKADPAFRIYDFHKKQQRFVEATTVRSKDDSPRVLAAGS